MSDYEHHLFISYRRSDKLWTRWARENVADALRTLLRPSIGNVSIFIDEQLETETGMSWPDGLARALARSRLLVPLLSRDYFNSDWCRIELDLMLRREQQCGFRCLSNPAVLVIPFIYDDGDCFPPEVKEMQAKPIHEFANPFVRMDTPEFVQFSEELRKECPRLVAALQAAPRFNPAWEQLAHTEFREKFRIKTETQNALPRLALRVPGISRSDAP